MGAGRLQPRWRGTLLALIASVISSTALAQGVPVADAANLSQSTNIQNCVDKIRKSSENRVAPDQGITKSHTTPGAAGQSGKVGSDDVTGAKAIKADGSSANFNVGGIDYSGLGRNGDGSTQANSDGLAGQNIGVLNQGLSAVNAVSGALTGNMNVLQAITGTVGTVTNEQQSFDQNTGARVSNIGLWNQVMQGAVLGARMRQQQLLNETAGQAAQVRTFTYTPTPSSGNQPAAKTTNGCDDPAGLISAGGDAQAVASACGPQSVNSNQQNGVVP